MTDFFSLDSIECQCQLKQTFCLCPYFLRCSLHQPHTLQCEQCASKVNGGGFSSSKEFPDEVLRFARSHPVMYRPVLPLHRRPVLLQTEPGRRKLTQIAVDRVQAQDGHYHVLYIGTGTQTVKNEHIWTCLIVCKMCCKDTLGILKAESLMLMKYSGEIILNRSYN